MHAGSSISEVLFYTLVRHRQTWNLPNVYDVYIIVVCGSNTIQLKEQKTSRSTEFLLLTPRALSRIPLAVAVEDPDAEIEQRFMTVGLGSAGVLLVVVYSERDGACRLISARRATRKERKQYED